MIIDCHSHLTHHSNPHWQDLDRKLVEAADKLGIDKLCCSTLTPTRPSDPDGFREANEFTWQGMQRFPGRVLGYCYVNPGWRDAALEEIRRCVEDRDFIGVKLYNEYPADEPVVFPIVELAIELQVPILHHAGHSHYFNEAQPRISDAGMLARLADRYPEAMLICGHLGGGGDWEWAVKALRRAPSVYADTSGSVVDDGLIEFAADTLGVDRLLFGCDLSMTAGVGKLRGARLSEAAKRKIYGTNMEQILSRRTGSC